MIQILEDMVTLGKIPRRQLEAVLKCIGKTGHNHRQELGLTRAESEMVGSFFFEVQELMEQGGK